MALRIGITAGDITGVGPEIIVKALLSKQLPAGAVYHLLGSQVHWDYWTTRLGGDLQSGVQFEPNPDASLPLSLPPGSPLAATAAVNWLRLAAEKCLSGEWDAVVTGPVNKAAIIQAGFSFVGQTEFLADLAATRDHAMMLLGEDDRGRWLRVALATTHLPLKDVSARLDQQQIVRVIRLTAKSCRDLGLSRARVGVCGLNPHAGEQGALGTEEQTTIEPAVRQACQQGLDVAGPLPADTLFHQAYEGKFDAVVAMYHDQGLAPLKMVCFEKGVNWTLGLPFARTSPDHGTAYDIAGRGVAQESSMLAAIQLAHRLAPQKPRQ